MKPLSVLFLSISFLFFGLETNAQIKIYDGRGDFAKAEITDQEKHLVENFVRSNEKEIKKHGVSRGFQCEKDSFRVDSVAQGFFTRKKLLQKAYLYQLCFRGDAQYATYLGGVVIVKNNKPSGHYVFSDISGYNNIKSLPDINRNGYSEVVLEFSHSINSLQFARAVKIFDLAPSGLLEMATLETFSRLSKTDVAYKIYGEKGDALVFSRETYESETQTNKWTLTEKLKNFETDAPIYTVKNLDVLPIYEFNAPTLTATEISQRVLKLIKSVKTVKDISTRNIEKITGLKMEFDPDDRNSYGASGKVEDTTWFYSLVTLSNFHGEKPKRLHFAFESIERDDSDLSFVCAVDFEQYKEELITAGFSETVKIGEHGRHLGWNFSKRGVSVELTDYLENEKKLDRKCVKSLTIQMN